MSRIGKCLSNTSETQIEVSINLDGTGKSDINTGIGFFDHMLISFAKQFFHAITYSTGMNLHIKMLEPGNNHHMIEGIYKAFAKALDQATIKDERITDVLSTKGTL